MQESRKKLVLINPPLSLHERYGGLEKAGNSLPNLGLCYLAAVARKQGWEVRIIDCPVLRISLSAIIQMVKKETPDIVGITATTPAIVKAHLVMKAVKEWCPDVLTLIGGPQISALPAETIMEFDSFDIGIVGEGELTLRDILDYAEGKKDIGQIDGIVYRTDGKVCSASPRPLISDLDTLPFPAWDLLPSLNKFYRPSLQCVKRLPATILVTSRGCPYQCIFCDHSVFGYRIRYHSSKYTIDMIKHLQFKYGIKDFAFHDECLLALKDRAIALAEYILKEGLNISWTVQARVDQVDGGILALFKKAGCWQIQLGIESGSENILKNLNKNISKERISEACNQIREAGLLLKGFFMLGNPGENEETIKETFQFACKLPLDDFQCTFFTPYPGSQIYRELDKWGTMLTGNFSEMNQYTVVFLPFSLSKPILEKEFKKGYRGFYLRSRIIKNYFFRMREPSLWNSYLRGTLEFLKFAL